MAKEFRTRTHVPAVPPGIAAVPKHAAAGRGSPPTVVYQALAEGAHIERRRRPMSFGPRGLETALANRTGQGRGGAGRRRAAARVEGL